MMGLHVVFAVDRAGLVGEDGETHHGVFDLGFLRQSPGMMVLCPASMTELQEMTQWAVEEYDGPVAIRYPRGTDRDYVQSAWDPVAAVEGNGVLSCHRKGTDVTLLTYGTLLQNTMDAAAILDQHGIQATVLRMLSVEPLPVRQILDNLSDNPHIIVVEEVCAESGIRQTLAWELTHMDPKIQTDGIDLGHNFVTHGSISSLYQHYGLDAQSIADFVQEVIPHEN